MTESIVKSIRIKNDLYKQFIDTYGQEFLSKYLNQAIKFGLKSKKHFSLVFWNEYENIIFSEVE